MSRPLILLILALVVIVGALVFLQSLAHEVPQTRVEKPVSPEVLGH